MKFQNLIVPILIVFITSCDNGDIEVLQPEPSSEKEILDFILENNSFEYRTNIAGNNISPINKLPFGTQSVQLKSIRLSDKAISNVKVGESISTLPGNYEILITAEDQSKKTYNLKFEIEEEGISDVPEETFTIVEYSPVSISKNFETPIMVHYMPWFQTPDVTGYWGAHWTMANRNPNTILSNGRRDIASHYYPLVEPYDSNDPDYLEYALLCIKLTGIDGILIDYYGTWNYNDYPQLLEASNAVIAMCEKVGLEYGIVYEDRTVQSIVDQGFSDKISLAKGDFQYMNDNYFKTDNYFKLDNKPVVLNFGPISIKSNDDWLNIFSSIDTQINFFPLAYHPQYYDLTTSTSGVYAWVGEIQDSSLYNYSSQFHYTGGGALFEFNEFYVEGGWGATSQGDISNRNGDLLRETLNRAKAASTDFIQLITWNDWGEGTAIEPSLDYEYQQLSIVQEFLEIENNVSDLELSVLLYKKRKEHKGKELENKKLDQIFYYLISLQTDKARDLFTEL